MAIDVNSLNSFCEGWLRKANNYRGDGLADPFDEFFTLFVVYNRIYVEIGKVLIHERHPSVKRFLSQSRFVRERKNFLQTLRPLPDRVSAIELMSVYLRKNNLCESIFTECAPDIDYIASSIENMTFYFNYDYNSDSPDVNKDRDLATNLKQRKINSVLELIYVARCNMFHGSKEFHDIQRILLTSMSNILAKISVRVLPLLIVDITEHNKKINKDT